MDEREQNKAVVRRFVTEIFQELKPAAVDELVADDFFWHGMGGGGDKKFLRDTTWIAPSMPDVRPPQVMILPLLPDLILPQTVFAASPLIAV